MIIFYSQTLILRPWKFLRVPECQDSHQSPLETHWGTSNSLYKIFTYVWAGLKQLWWDIKLFLEKP